MAELSQLQDEHFGRKLNHRLAKMLKHTTMLIDTVTLSPWIHATMDQETDM